MDDDYFASVVGNQKPTGSCPDHTRAVTACFASRLKNPFCNMLTSLRVYILCSYYTPDTWEADGDKAECGTWNDIAYSVNDPV